MSEGIPTACTTIEEVGSTGVGALTVAFLILVVTTIVFLFKANGSGEQRKYYYLSTYMCGFAAMAYFAMLSGQGWTAIAGCRQFFYARYADWLVTTVLTVVLLGSVAGASGDVIGGAVGADVIMIFAGYMGSVSVVTTVKWFWFLIGVMGLIGVVVHFAQTFKAAADSKGGDIATLYGKIAWVTILAWICYPVIWLFSEGFASFSVSFEVCAYALVDIIAKVVMSFMVMSAHDLLGEGAQTREYAVAYLSHGELVFLSVLHGKHVNTYLANKGVWFRLLVL
nr:protein 101 [synthetic construct]